MNDLAVIFDMDGVLVDSRQQHFDSWRVSGQKYGFDITLEKYNEYFGQTSEVFARTICEEYQVDDIEAVMADWLAYKDECYRKIFKKDYKENPAVSNLVKNLNDSGFRTGVGSSAPRTNVEDLVEVMPHGEYLKEYVSGDDVVEGKPHPEVFLKVADKLGVLARKCAVIEDSIHGLTAAKKAGMAAIAITGTHEHSELAEHADMVINSLDEVDAERIQQIINA